MRWLIAGVIALSLAGGVARSQSLTANVCPRFDAPWARVSGGTDPHRMQAVIDTIPPFCPLRKRAEQHLAEVRGRIARANALPGAGDHPAPQAGQPTPEQSNAADEEPPPPPTAPPTIIAGPPPDPCSPEAIDLQDPSLPAGGPDPAWAPKSRAAYAGRYLARARAFKLIAMRCGANLTAPLQNDSYAVELDPKNPLVLKARAEAYIDTGNFQAAIDDFSSAIAARGDVDPDQDMLLLYADRAFAYSRLGMHGEEIADLQKVVDRIGLLNADARGALLTPSTYKVRLARAFAETGDIDDAEAEYIIVDPTALDWQDLLEVGSIKLQRKDWDKAIASLSSALTKLAAAPDGAQQGGHRAQIEIALGQAYAARGSGLDLRNAWDSYQQALADAPGDATATAGLAALTPPPAKPTFQEPALQAVALPDGVSSLDAIAEGRPHPFCTAKGRNDYLDSEVHPVTDTLNANMNILGRYSDSLETWRAQYAANTMLRFAEMNDDLAIFDVEIARIAALHAQMAKQGYAVLDYFKRVAGDASLVIVCKNNPGG